MDTPNGQTSVVSETVAAAAPEVKTEKKPETQQLTWDGKSDILLDDGRALTIKKAFYKPSLVRSCWMALGAAIGIGAFIGYQSYK